MTDPLIAQGHGLTIRQWHPVLASASLIVLCPTGRTEASGLIGITEEQMRWLINTGGPAALAALEQEEAA